MEKERYALEGTAEVVTPALVCFEALLKENTRRAIAIAGGPERLWPHVKTHKSAAIVRQMQAMGIRRFKCATIAEAEMLADCQAEHILLAYPLIGPNIGRWLRLTAAYPGSHFYAIGDSREGFAALSAAAAAAGRTLDAMVDVNMGMNRTGMATADCGGLYRYAAGLPGLRLVGLHCYDGHHHDSDLAERQRQVDASVAEIQALIDGLEADGFACPIRVMGGTPSFPCHAQHPQGYLSPGTCFLMDAGYQARLPDLPFVPAAVVLSRVVSHPAPGLFTLDLGYKGIAADPAGQRGRIVELPTATPVLHSEEHWVWRTGEGEVCPAIGEMVTVIPTHICPTSALYPAFLVARDRQIADQWPVTARNRKLTY